MKTLPAALLIARNDLLTFFRDRTAVLLGFLLPVGLIAVFGLVMSSIGGGSGGMPRVSLWVVDQDRSVASRSLLAALSGSDMIRVRTPQPDEAEETLSIVADGEASHLLVIESGYAGSPSAERLRLVRDPGRAMEDRVIGMSLTQALMAEGVGGDWGERLAEMFAGLGMEGAALDEFGRRSDAMTETIDDWFRANPAPEDADVSPFDMFAGGSGVPTQDVVPPDRPKNTTYQLAQSISGTAVMMLMFGLATCATVLLVEREGGTMARLLASAAPRSSILLGKSLYVAAVGVMQMLVMLAAGELMFGVGTFREPLTLAVVTGVWVATSTAIGMLIATASQTRKQAESWSPVIVLPLAALGGCWFPLQLADLPWAVDLATKATPTYWAMSAYQGYFWRAQNWTAPSMLTAMAVQLAFAVGLAGLSVWSFRRNYLRGGATA